MADFCAAVDILPHVVAPLPDLQAGLTCWEMLERHCDLFIAFGGIPLKNTQVASGGAGAHRVPDSLRRMRSSGVRFVNVDPFRDSLAVASDDDWFAIRPNTDVALMLALAYELVANGLRDREFLARCCVGFERFEQYLLGRQDGEPKSSRWASSITGIAADRIERLARDMAGGTTMINVAWAMQRAAHGEQPYWMCVTLAAILGQIGRPGGGFGIGYGSDSARGSNRKLLKGPTLAQGANPVRSFIPVARVADMLLKPGETFAYDGGVHAYPHIRLVYWAGGNPFHHHQDLRRLKQAWQRPETIVVHEQYWTPTAKAADIVLPISTNLERNDIGFANLAEALVAMPGIMAPHAESVSDFQAFSWIADRLGFGDGFAEGRDEMGWVRKLYEDFRSSAAPQNVMLPVFETFWERGLVEMPLNAEPVVLLEKFRADPEKRPLRTPSGKIEIFSETIHGFALPDCAGHPRWYDPCGWLDASSRELPFHLISDQPATRLHSQLDGSGHSIAGKRGGREQADINADDAAELGIADGDLIELFNDRGRCLAAARPTTGIRRGVVKLPTGAWCAFDEEGREIRGNPNALTTDKGSSMLSQGCSAQTCRVAIRRCSGVPDDAPAFDGPELRSGG